MKRIFLFILLLSTFGCTQYFVRDSSQYNLTKEELEFLKSKKIGLIGFYPFDYIQGHTGSIKPPSSKIDNELHLKMIRFVNNKENQTVLSEMKNSYMAYSFSKFGYHTSTAVLDRYRRTTEFLEFGADPERFEKSGSNSSIQKDDLRNFLTNYLAETRDIGLDVLEPLLILTNDNQAKTDDPLMKNFDVDYWVIAYHGPVFQKNVALNNLTVIPFVYTLGFFPLLSNRDIESTFLVFDKKLHHVKTFEYKGEGYTFTSWLAFGGEAKGYGIFHPTPSATIYKPDIKQFSKELVQVLKK